MTVRDPGFDPRRQAHPVGGRPPVGAGPRRPAWLLPGVGALVVVALLVVVVGSGVLGGGQGSAAPSGGSGLAAASGAVPTGAPSTAGSSVSPSAGASSESPSPASTVAATPGLADVPIVPVTNFRSVHMATTAAEVKAIASGGSPYSALVLVAPDADAILGALGLDRKGLGSKLVLVDSAAALATNLAANRTRLGFLAVDEVGASVRALGWGAKSLFGVGRVAKLANWPLHAQLVVPGGAATYDPAAAWTLVAGGDILLDRGVSLAIQGSKRSTNFPFDGGTVDITGHCKDCSPFGWDLPYTKRTGNTGAVRDLIKGADIAIANFENPAPDTFRFHGKGTVFSANPRYIKGLQAAGLDWVSVANNHIGDAGRKGILQTLTNLDKYGIKHSGAGKNTAAAHKAAILEAGGVKVGLLGYDTIAAGYQAGPSTPGSARLTAASLKTDVAAARKAGADVVIVFPHWGTEYSPKPFAGQQKLAHAAIDAGADMVIGNHAHWAGAMEVYRGRPIWYALGNFVFDQTWSEPTMEGITLDLTFRGKQLVQARMRPHLILGKAQPNFLDPAGAGRVVMSQIFRASKGLLAW